MLSTAAQDFFVICALVFTFYVMARNMRAIDYSGFTRELGLIAVGMAIWGAYHFLHLVFLFGGPFWLDAATMQNVGTVMQAEVRWAVETVATVLFLAGLVKLTWRFGRLVQNLEQSDTALKHEHDARATLEGELKAASLTQRETGQKESEFLLGLSHELRTPLNGIVGLGNLLGNTDLDPTQRKLLATLEQSAQAVLARVGGVIDLSRLRTEQVEVRNLAFLPAELLKSVEALFSPSAAEKGLVLTTSATEAAHLRVIGDSRLTKQLLTTLASLAVKQCESGSIRLLIDIEAAGDELRWVKITLLATGLVFAPGVIEQVRAESVSLRGDGGISLAICSRLTALMDGEIAIDSQAGPGTVISVRLPMRREP